MAFAPAWLQRAQCAMASSRNSASARIAIRSTTSACAARWKSIWRENFQAYINGYYFKDKGNNYTRRIDRDPNNTANFFPFKVSSNTPNEGEDRSKGASIDFTWNLGNVELRSLTGYDRTNTSGNYDLDGNPVRLAQFGVGIGMKVVHAGIPGRLERRRPAEMGGRRFLLQGRFQRTADATSSTVSIPTAMALPA